MQCEELRIRCPCALFGVAQGQNMVGALWQGAQGDGGLSGDDLFLKESFNVVAIEALAEDIFFAGHEADAHMGGMRDG